MMNAVGGTSIHYWAQSWRLKPWDFRTRSESVRRYGPNSIPKGSTLEDWPITYDELESYQVSDTPNSRQERHNTH